MPRKPHFGHFSHGNRVASKENVVSQACTAGRLPQTAALRKMQPQCFWSPIKKEPQTSGAVDEKEMPQYSQNVTPPLPQPDLYNMSGKSAFPRYLIGANSKVNMKLNRFTKYGKKCYMHFLEATMHNGIIVIFYITLHWFIECVILIPQKATHWDILPFY